MSCRWPRFFLLQCLPVTSAHALGSGILWADLKQCPARLLPILHWLLDTVNTVCFWASVCLQETRLKLLAVAKQHCSLCSWAFPKCQFECFLLPMVFTRHQDFYLGRPSPFSVSSYYALPRCFSLYIISLPLTLVHVHTTVLLKSQAIAHWIAYISHWPAWGLCSLSTAAKQVSSLKQQFSSHCS